MVNLVIKYRKQFIFIGIVLYTFLFVTWISYSDNPFLQDDNGLQWNPVIETAFRQFFSTGHMPQYNFYQLKGYDIFQVGYYGLYNPLMYIACLCSLIFQTNPLCAYTYISFVIGNCVVFELGRKSKCSEILSLMIMLLYSASSVFFYYAYWYYAMENYWMIPLLFLLFLGENGGKRPWYQYGLWMAFSVYLGNIQFTMYHWMICGIAMLVIWAVRRDGYWKKIGTNIATALAFSLFPLIGVMKASGRSEVYSGKNADFMAYPVKFMQYLNESVFGFRGINLLLLCAFFVGVYELLCQIRKNKEISYQVSILFAAMVVSVFFALFMGGEEYLLAKILYKIPGLSSSRYLMKIMLVLPGCMLPLSIDAFRHVFQTKKQNNMLRIVAGQLLVMVCFVIGVKQSQIAYGQPFSGEFGGEAALDIGRNIQRIYDMDYLDLSNYRVVSLISGQNENDYDAYYTETHNVESLLPGNLGTKLSVFSLGGYDNTFHSDSLKSVVRLYREDAERWSSWMESEMFSVRNTISLKTLMRNIYRQGDYNAEVWNAVRERYPDYELLKTEYQYDEFGICRGVILFMKRDGAVQLMAVSLDELGLIHKSTEVFDILAQNGVKYLFYDQSIQTQVEQLRQECDALGIGCITGSVSSRCKYIEFNDTVPIVSNQDGQALPMIVNMDRIQISVGIEDVQCRLSMTYDEKLKAWYYPDQDSQRVELDIDSDAFHNMVINLSDCKNGCIVITYENSFNLLCLFQMGLLLASIVFPPLVHCRISIADRIRKIGIDKIAVIGMSILIAIYAIYMFHVCLHTEALVADEQWFLDVLETIHVNSVGDYVKLPNYLGYGPIYWLIMSKVGTFLNMRILCWGMLISVIPAILITILSQNPQQKVSACFPAVILCLTAPLSWYTGKIIGPEIMGYSLGIWGCTVGVCAMTEKHKTKKIVLLTAGILIGISTGIKLNYGIFGVFTGLYAVLSDGQGKFGRSQWRAIADDAFCLLVGAVTGFVCSSPVCLLDFEEYTGNFETFNYSLTYLREVLFKDYVEWDFVNSGGLNHTIISFAALVCFWGLAIRECMILKEKMPTLFISGAVSVLILFLLCSKEMFLGWYLLPVIYLISINLSHRKLTYVFLIMNLILIAPNIWFQIYAKEVQIRYVRQKDVITNLVSQYEEQWNDYESYVFIDYGIGELPLDDAYFYHYYLHAEDEKKILFLSGKSLYNRQLNNIYQDALYQKNGYRFIANKNDINVILYEREASRS